jgi:hypothetical protein
MSIGAISGSSPVSPNTTSSTNAKPATQSAPTAQPATSQGASTAAAAKVAVVAVNEATETAAQTIREAAGGDRQAQKRLHIDPTVQQGSTTGNIIDTKA